MLERQLAHFVHIDALALTADPVGNDLVGPAGEVDRAAVGEMAPVIEVHGQDRIARLEQGVIDRGVGLGTRMRLDIRVLDPEEFLGPLDGKRLDFVDEFASTVIAPPGVALGIFIRENTADRFEDGFGNKIFRGDQLDGQPLPTPLIANKVRDLGVDEIQFRGR
jgi:hypothetical protein